eukprot:Colp12_sorted_trinity150504_noHs@7944
MVRQIRVQDPAEVVPGLFIGSAKPAQDKEWLTDAGITHIVNVTELKEDGAPLFPCRYPNNFTYKHICVRDDVDVALSNHFHAASEFILDAHRKNGRVLVHCKGGVSRSATIVIAFLMKQHRLSFRDALWHLKRRKSNVGPNIAFMAQLVELERSLYGKATYTKEAYMHDVTKYEHYGVLPDFLIDAD